MNFHKILLIEKWKIIHESMLKIQKESYYPLLPKYLSKKIYNETYKGFGYSAILKKIQQDVMYASFFVKDPIKQNLAEKLQYKMLLKKYPKLIKLPALGINAKYLVSGRITNVKNKKSLDFYDIENNCYYICKYTHECGGAQDQVYSEIQKYIIEINQIQDDKINFKLLLDGNYWVNKIENLKSTITNSNCTITTSQE
jgi:hypothetical protein